MTYNKDGNILSKTECSYTTSGTPSIIGVTSFTYGSERHDVLSKITLPDGKEQNYSYDIVGNPSHLFLEDGNQYAATWSYGRRLTMACVNYIKNGGQTNEDDKVLHQYFYRTA